MPKKVALTLAVLIVFFGLACGGDGAARETSSTTPAQPTAQPIQTPVPTSSPSPPPSREDLVKVVNQDVGGSGEYKFVPAEFNFKVG